MKLEDDDRVSGNAAAAVATLTPLAATPVPVTTTMGTCF
jgi:hypothetical protein